MSLNQNLNFIFLFFLAACHNMDDCIDTELLAAYNQSASVTIDHDFISHMCFVVELKNTCADQVIVMGNSLQLGRKSQDLENIDYHINFSDIVIQHDESDTTDFLINVDNISRTQYTKIMNDQYFIYFKYLLNSNPNDTLEYRSNFGSFRTKYGADILPGDILRDLKHKK
ncbi:MAG: hypothetical protein IPL46_10095 [Saprospiraceae bacterium]|nr:hypothetical protein [Saprospiraceae bacterium]